VAYYLAQTLAHPNRTHLLPVFVPHSFTERGIILGAFACVPFEFDLVEQSIGGDSYEQAEAST